MPRFRKAFFLASLLISAFLQTNCVHVHSYSDDKEVHVRALGTHVDVDNRHDDDDHETKVEVHVPHW